MRILKYGFNIKNLNKIIQFVFNAEDDEMLLKLLIKYIIFIKYLI